MYEPILTVNEIFFLLKPFSINVFMIFFACFLLLVMFYLYKEYKNEIPRVNYLILCLFIIVNSVFIPLFMQRIAQESIQFNNLSRNEAIKKLWPGDLNEFYTLLDSRIKDNETFYFLNSEETDYKDFIAKYRLAYHFAPRKFAKKPEDVDYLIIVNYSGKLKGDIKIPDGKVGNLYKYSDQLSFIKLEDKVK